MLEEHIEFAKFNYELLDSCAKNTPTIFQYNQDMNKTAYLNWRTGFARTQRNQFTIIAEAFFSSAYNLICQCLQENNDKKADSWIFPIMFNIVHGIEVYLKAINVSLNLMLDKYRPSIEGEHNIKQLCEVAKALIKECNVKYKNTTTKDMSSTIKVVYNFIVNIYDKTTDMTFARYPINKNKEDHFYIRNLANEVIDLEMLKDQVISVNKALEFIFDEAETEAEFNMELMQDYYGDIGV